MVLNVRLSRCSKVDVRCIQIGLEFNGALKEFCFAAISVGRILNHPETNAFLAVAYHKRFLFLMEDQ